MAAKIQPCRIVRAPDPTEVASALATSLAPVKKRRMEAKAMLSKSQGYEEEDITAYFFRFFSSPIHEHVRVHLQAFDQK